MPIASHSATASRPVTTSAMPPRTWLQAAVTGTVEKRRNCSGRCRPKSSTALWRRSTPAVPDRETTPTLLSDEVLAERTANRKGRPTTVGSRLHHIKKLID